MKTALLSLCAVLALSCGPRHAPKTEPEAVYLVSIPYLTRDIWTARSYSGCLIAIELDKGAYEMTNTEIIFRGPYPGLSPLITFRCPFLPSQKIDCIIYGRCAAPIQDGIWRNATADFYLVVESCSVIPR